MDFGPAVAANKQPLEVVQPVVVRMPAVTARGDTFQHRLRLAQAKAQVPMPASVRVTVNVLPVVM